jgi:hypothetical protein
VLLPFKEAEMLWELILAWDTRESWLRGDDDLEKEEESKDPGSMTTAVLRRL